VAAMGAQHKDNDKSLKLLQIDLQPREKSVRDGLREYEDAEEGELLQLNAFFLDEELKKTKRE
jgi:hypothetical protein